MPIYSVTKDSLMSIRTGVRIELGSVKELHERRILSNFSGGNEFPSQRYDNEPKETKTI